MSDYETHCGKLRKVDLQGKSKEEFFEELCKKDGLEMKSYAENWEDNYRYSENNDYKYVTNGEVVWEIYDHVENNDLDHFTLVSNNDETYTFSTTFYNGGTCLEELIEEEVSKL